MQINISDLMLTFPSFSPLQNLLQWTAKEHPDCSLLLGTERALRGVLSRCHGVLEEEVRWEEGEGAGPRSEHQEGRGGYLLSVGSPRSI